MAINCYKQQIQMSPNSGTVRSRYMYFSSRHIICPRPGLLGSTSVCNVPVDVHAANTPRQSGTRLQLVDSDTVDSIYDLWVHEVGNDIALSEDCGN